MLDKVLEELKAKGLLTTTARRVDLKHLLSAERAARGSFYATRVGFVAINPKGHRIARAHNGFPTNVKETRERWSKSQKDFYHLHAECAGVFHAARLGYATKGATAYVTHPPCPGCMRTLIAAEFTRVVFSEQALLERRDWREDMQKTFTIAHDHKMEVVIYRDRERSLKNADITRTEVDLKKVYDGLVPEARWSSTDKSEISPATRPEGGDWVAQPVVAAIIKAAAAGATLEGAAVIADFQPECRAATAIIQAGIRHVFVLQNRPDPNDTRWAEAIELARADKLLREDAGIRITATAEEKTGLKALIEASGCRAVLDASRGGVNLGESSFSLLRF